MKSDLTSLLQAWSAGDHSTEEKLWPLVFAELKRLARRYLAHERPNHTLKSGASVNEVYVQLADLNSPQGENRARLFAMCARMMRQILADHARAQQSQNGVETGRESHWMRLLWFRNRKASSCLRWTML